MGKTEVDWNGLKLGFLKTVQSNSFSKLIPAACNLKKKFSGDIFVCVRSLILSFARNFFAYFKFRSDWGRVIGKIKQNELDCHDTAPLKALLFLWVLTFAYTNNKQRTQDKIGETSETFIIHFY